jgi:hypothetical protein
MKIPEQFLSELKSAGLLRSLRNVECLPGGMARTPQLLQRLQHLESLPDAADMSLRAQPECGSQAKPANPRFRTAVPLRNHDPEKVPRRHPGNKPRIRRE